MSSMKSKRLESIKIIVSESIMVLVVIVTVVVLAFVVSGYWLNSDFKVERQGMLQVSSIPTGASVSIDSEKPSWLFVTNTSKILSSGEHTIELTKAGYDTWSKTITISEGLLHRLHYPRLFLKERTSESVAAINNAITATVSPDRNRLVLINNTPEWTLVELDAETPKYTKIDISKLFPNLKTGDGAKRMAFLDEITVVDWNSDNSRFLFRGKTSEGSEEWVLLDVDNLEKSINITKEFGADFDSIKILNHSADTLLATRNSNLHKIDLSHKSVSSVLVKNVIDFDHLGNEVVFSAHLEDDDMHNNKQYYVGIFKIGDAEIKELKQSPFPLGVAISKFYDETYIATTFKNEVAVYQKNNNSYKEILNQSLNIEPIKIKVGHHGEFFVFSRDNNIATLDMESKTTREWQTEGIFGWLDDDMIYSIKDSNLVIYDYDGFNRRELSSGVSSHFPVTITDDKWLYYVSDRSLVRELIVKN